MVVEARHVGTLSDGGEVYQVVASLNRQVEAFSDVGINDLIDVEKATEVRLQGISNDWTRTNILPLAVKGGRTVLRKLSPYTSNAIMAEVAVNANRRGEYPSLSIDSYESAKALAEAQEGMEPEDRTAIIIPFDGHGQFRQDMDVTRFTLGESMNPYFAGFVSGGQVPFFNLLGQSTKETTAGYLWFIGPQGDSELNAGFGYLNYAGRAFGALYSGEAGVQNSGFSLTQIGKANSEVIPVVLEEQGFSGAINTLARPLKKGLIERLRSR
jgi:hypothetical protein